jgi:hypothetical protein
MISEDVNVLACGTNLCLSDGNLTPLLVCLFREYGHVYLVRCLVVVDTTVGKLFSLIILCVFERRSESKSQWSCTTM